MVGEAQLDEGDDGADSGQAVVPLVAGGSAVAAVVPLVPSGSTACPVVPLVPHGSTARAANLDELFVAWGRNMGQKLSICGGKCWNFMGKLCRGVDQH